jgi:hypothetical protein
MHRLDEPVGDYTDLFSVAPVTMYQFLIIWTKFAPAQYHSAYFLFDEAQQKWSVDRELIVTILTALERLQHIIMDVIGIVGEEPHHFVIDCDLKLTEQLWMFNEFKDLKMADTLLKLQVDLTFIKLAKLRKLHQGEILSTPMATEDLLPPTPKLKDCLHKARLDPCLPTKNVAC